jgi:hypothetical protein
MELLMPPIYEVPRRPIQYHFPQRPALPSSPPDVKPLESMRSALQEVRDGRFGKVSDVNQTLAALPAAERNALVAQLSDDELETWITAAARYTNPKDQEPLFDALAQGLDDRQLGRVIDMLDRDNALNTDNVAIVNRMGEAIVANKSPAELVQFVRSTAGQAEHDQKAALIVATALETLGAMSRPSTYSGGIPYTPPNHLETVLASLSSAQLDSVVQAATQGRIDHNVRVYEPSLLLSLLDRAADGPLSSQQRQRLVEASMKVLPSFYARPDESPRADPAPQVLRAVTRLIDSEHGASVRNKAVLFETVTAQWKAGDHGSMDRAIATSLKALIMSDTNGLMDELESQQPDGVAMTEFVREMIAQGRAKELHPIIAQLQLGNALSGDPIARFEAVDRNGDSTHAEDLGYFVGTAYAAIEQLNHGREKNAGLLGELFGIGSSFIPNPVASGSVDALGSAIDKAEQARIERYQNANLDLLGVLEELAYPKEPDGRLYNGSQAEGPYETALAEVMRNNPST